MDNRSRPIELYTIELELDISNDEDGHSKGTINGNQWGEDKVTSYLINIVTNSQNESESTQDDNV
jgi:hypothetical protein